MKRQTVLNISGVDYSTIIEYKVTNYIRYRFEDNKLVVKCPYFVSDNYLTELITKKGIKRNDLKREKPFDFDYCYIYGEKQSIKDGFVNIDGHFILFNKDTFYKDINKYFNDYVTTRIRYYESVMGIDKPYSVASRFTSSRYGSNSVRTHHISMNSYLIHFSKDIIDTVVVHELAHCFYFDHSKNFYNLVYKYSPNYKILHKQLTKGIYKGVDN